MAAAKLPSAVESLARAASASGKFGGVTGVFAGVRNCNETEIHGLIIDDKLTFHQSQESVILELLKKYAETKKKKKKKKEINILQ